MESTENAIETQAREVNEKGFLPTDSVDLNLLPSKGLAYPMNAKISIRPYSFGEVKRIADSSLSTEEKFATVVSGINTNFDKSLLTFADITYLGIVRKLNTVGGLKFTVPFICWKCKKKQEHTFSQDDITVKDLDVPKLPVVAPMSNGESFEFGPIDYKNLRQIADGTFDKYVPNGRLLDDKVAIYALLCKNKKFNDVYKFFSMTTDNDDHELLNEVDNMLAHDVEPLEAKCSNKKCKEVNHIQVNNLISMVLPFRKQKESVRSRISFGKTHELSRE